MRRMLAQLERLETRLEWLFQRTEHLIPGQVNTVDFKELADFPELLDIPLAEGVTAKRLPVPYEDGLYFYTQFEEEAVLPLHCHDAHEILTVNSGTLIETVTGRIIQPGEEILIPSKIQHRLKALYGQVSCYVFFKRSNHAPDSDQYEIL